MRESLFQSKIVKLLRAAGAVTFNVHGHEMQAAGWPDLYVAHVRWTGWIELKCGARVSSLQARRIRELTARGVNAIVMRLTKEDAVEIDEWCIKLDELDRTNIIDFLISAGDTEIVFS